jgi:hypothetical protein
MNDYRKFSFLLSFSTRQFGICFKRGVVCRYLFQKRGRRLLAPLFHVPASFSLPSNRGGRRLLVPLFHVPASFSLPSNRGGRRLLVPLFHVPSSFSLPSNRRVFYEVGLFRYTLYYYSEIIFIITREEKRSSV